MNHKVNIFKDERYPDYGIRVYNGDDTSYHYGPPEEYFRYELTEEELQWIRDVEKQYREVQTFLAEKYARE